MSSLSRLAGRLVSFEDESQRTAFNRLLRRRLAFVPVAVSALEMTLGLKGRLGFSVRDARLFAIIASLGVVVLLLVLLGMTRSCERH